MAAGLRMGKKYINQWGIWGENGLPSEKTHAEGQKQPFRSLCCMASEYLQACCKGDAYI